jgi:outer membrane protein OmpA-like peptidoglycan-associated protein
MVDMGGAGKWMFDRSPSPSFKFKQRRYPVESDPDAGQPQRIIDAEDEQIRKLFDDLRRAMDTRASDQPPPLTRIVTTPIRFNPSEAALDAPAMDFLATLVSELGQDMQTDQADVYVFATAPDAASTKEQFILSARRAQAVRDRLARNFVEKPSGTSSRLLARGIGAGHWGVNAAAVSPPSVVIAVVSPVRKE